MFDAALAELEVAEAASPEDALAAKAAKMDAGPKLAAAIAGLDLAELGDQGRVDYLVTTERLSRWVEAKRLAALAVHLGPEIPLGAPDYGVVALERSCRLSDVALALGSSDTAVRNQGGAGSARLQPGPARGRAGPARRRGHVGAAGVDLG